MYRPVPGIYTHFAWQDQTSRTRRINVFSITLAPFAANWNDVVRTLIHLTHLEVSINITLNNSSKVTVTAPCLAYLSNMPQQNFITGCRSQNATHFCSKCFIALDH